jgi:glycosyltransferase involved in cell wall biosynthesis
LPSERTPLVSVICLCYNQAPFLKEALDSVLAQTYPAWELIIVDDASTDGSVAIIQDFLKAHPIAEFIPLPHNLGNCRAFNQGLARARGEYVIDLAADDVMLPERLKRQVAVFEAMGDKYGVIYTNAIRIDENSRELGFYYPDARSRANLPRGDVYAEVLKRSFICPPTMMMRKKVLDELGGYDESLNYEDFDFWVRSSRNHYYEYLDEVLTARREVSTSHSRKFYKQKGIYTLKVGEKAAALNRTPAEWQAWGQCVRYHLRQAFLTENFELAGRYVHLLRKHQYLTTGGWLVMVAAKLKIKVSTLYKFYLKKRYGLEL